MPRRPHDALFKWAFESPADAAALLRELLPPAIRDAIAWDTLDVTRSSFVDVALADRHSDLLFEARLRTPEPTLVYLLLEHQSTDDPRMPLRMLAYQTQLWSRLGKEQPGAQPLPPILAVLVSHSPRGWTSARAFEQLLDPAAMAIPELAALVPRFSLVVEDLTHHSDVDLQARALPPFQRVALWLLRDARNPARLLSSFDAWKSTILEAGQARSGPNAITVLIQYLFEILDPLYFDLLRAKLEGLGTHSREIAMTIAEYLEEKGREEGRRATLRSLLDYKFGTLDAVAEACLRVATPEALDRYLRRILTAASLTEVFEA